MKTTQKTQTTAQQIKTAIKAAGIPTKNISVTTSYPGYEVVINIIIKDVFIDLSAVKKIAHPFECVSWDQCCGEILQGGNTFVRCRYDYNAEDAAVKALEPLAADAIKAIAAAAPGIVTLSAPNGVTLCAATFSNSDHWVIYQSGYDINDIDHRAYFYINHYYPDARPGALARVFFDLGARYVDNIPDPEPTPDPDPETAAPVYVVAAGAQSFTGYAVESCHPDYTTAAAYAAGYAESDIENGKAAPVYYVCTRAAVLARVDNKGIHAPKDKPQRTPGKVLLMLDAYELHNAS